MAPITIVLVTNCSSLYDRVLGMCWRSWKGLKLIWPPVCPQAHRALSVRVSGLPGRDVPGHHGRVHPLPRPAGSAGRPEPVRSDTAEPLPFAGADADPGSRHSRRGGASKLMSALKVRPAKPRCALGWRLLSHDNRCSFDHIPSTHSEALSQATLRRQTDCALRVGSSTSARISSALLPLAAPVAVGE